MTHLPFQSWCRHCVRGRGKEAAHRKQADDGGLRELHFDFMFMGKEDEPGKLMTTLVVKEKKTKMKMASVVPTKSTGEFIIERVLALAFTKEIGIDAIDVVARSDQEPAVKRLIEEIGRRKRRDGRKVVGGELTSRSHRKQREG